VDDRAKQKREGSGLECTVRVRRPEAPSPRPAAALASRGGPGEPPASEGRQGEAATASLWRRGEYWTVGYAGTVVHLRDTKGLHYLAALLAEPEREWHVLDLAARAAGAPGSQASAPARPSPAGSGERIDTRAREAYRQRLHELRRAVEDAEARNDRGAVERARHEAEWIERELVAAFGLGRRPRRHADPVERTRKAVYARLRSSLASIRAVHPELGRHLSCAVRTGTRCVYRPERDPGWRISLAG